MKKFKHFLQGFLFFYFCFYVTGIVVTGEINPWLWSQRQFDFMLKLGAFFSALLSAILVVLHNEKK